MTPRGDVILADRGFNIQESASMFHAEAKIPPFTRGKKQLSRMEVDKSCDLSRVRIHVERVMVCLNKSIPFSNHMSQSILWNAWRGNHTVLSTILFVCVVHCVTAV